jgi:hypothetical protein
MGNIIYSRQQLVTGSTSIANMTPQGVRSTDFTATANSIYDITASCRMTLPSNPSIGDRVAFILTSNAIFDITSTDRIDGRVLATDFVRRVQVTGIWFVWTYSGSTNGWIWNSVYTSSIGEVYVGTGDANTVLYLKFDEATPIDSSVIPKTLTVVGTSQNTSDKKIGTSSRSFAQSNSYITVNHPDLTLGTGNFTIESWVKYSSFSGSSARGLFMVNTEGLGGPGQLNINRQANMFLQSTAIPEVSVSNTFAPINTWHHLAITRSGNTFTIWVNGVARGSTTSTSNLTGTFWAIGTYNTSSYCWGGLIDSFRITKGIARYTGTFNPETDTGLT